MYAVIIDNIIYFEPLGRYDRLRCIYLQFLFISAKINTQDIISLLVNYVNTFHNIL